MNPTHSRPARVRPAPAFEPEAIGRVLRRLDLPCYVFRQGGRTGVAHEPVPGTEILTTVGPLHTDRLGSATFRQAHGVRGAYMAGSMATGIASVELVGAMARAGYLASFGAAGLSQARTEQAVSRLGRELSGLPWAANLIHSPRTPRLERRTVDLYLAHGVRRVEASAFVDITTELVRYRAAGLRPDPCTGVHAGHHVIAKLSRPEVAERFLRPAPDALLDTLAAEGRITAEQARLARLLPLADDITAEADSAGHTDGRPLTVLLPELLELRDRLAPLVRVGAAGGLGTPLAVHAAFALGADYVVTGSVNQACVEAGTSDQVKQLLAEAGPADCTTAPAADMFELGVDVQVLHRGSLFPGRARWLYRLYRELDSLDDLAPADRERLERQVFRRPVQEVERAQTENRPQDAERSARDPKFRMASTFRWYLGNSARWATGGERDRSADFQIWCGPAMGAFNAWTGGTPLALPRNRRVADIADRLLAGAAYHGRLTQLRLAGVRLPAAVRTLGVTLR
ncbi:PfaD family polyunsaturated fatty acid/polyketide biosynthesis protein [Streptomyces sp. NPDC059564]|uniref:PfaD family polyunsaturated fatty acid/polyketide biosynthesis protein n=1 Tax=Streptomyces sp. NPDC059564 TaxID=3346865 RepID=UPI0036CE704B